MPLLKEGDLAPPFALPNQDGIPVGLEAAPPPRRIAGIGMGVVPVSDLMDEAPCGETRAGGGADGAVRVSVREPRT